MTLFRILRKLCRDDGSSLAAVMMVLLVVSTIGVAGIQLAQHSNDTTTVDRERLQSLEAAEAGVTDAIRRIQLGSGCDTSATAAKTLDDQAGSVGRYRTRVDPESGTTCGQTLKRVIHSWGFAPTGGNRALRHLEITVSLVPQGGFPYTLFAEGGSGTIYVKNNGTIGGDVYAETLDQSKNNLSAFSVVTTGSFATQNNASYSGTVWAGGNIVLNNNNNIGQSLITSGTASGSQGTITMGNGTVVGQDAIAKSTVTGGTVNGTISQNNPNVPPPPNLVKPAFVWDAANYTPAPTQGTAAQITTALNTNKSNLQGTYRSTDAGTITIPSPATVTGPLNIISTGKIAIGGTMTASGGPWEVALVALSTAADSLSGASAFTGSSGLDILMYSLGAFDMKNNVNFKGAVYADSIDAKNNFTITKSTALATTPPPGFTFDASSSSTYAAIPTVWREIVPGTPPS